ncbi:MAG: extracellular solute-binding protein [Clostridia bacterium]|nr:extracellular solute-binding protein [Clostridia bacterium]
MRRFGMALCAVLMLCQLLAFPVAADNLADEKTDYDETIVDEEIVTVGPSDAETEDGEAEGDSVDTEDAGVPETPELEYTDYKSDMPDTKADAEVKVEALDATGNDETVTVGDDSLRWDRDMGAAYWQVEVPTTGWYAVAFSYMGIEGSSADIEVGLAVDGAFPYAEAARFVLARTWKDVLNEDGKPIREDTKGNQFSAEQTEVYEIAKYPMRDVNGFVNEDLCLYLEAGTHELMVYGYGVPFALYSIHLEKPQELLSMEDQLAVWKDAGIKDYTGEEFIIEAENATFKSDRALIGLSDNSNPSVIPADAFIQKVNYIGGSNWSMPNATITWTVDAPAEGLYKVGFHFRQHYLVNAAAYRCLRVNGASQYQEQTSIAFNYKNSWQFGDTYNNGEEILVYLDKGPNELSLSVTLGDMNAFSARLENVVFRLGNMYRDIIAIIGETPDKGRDYDLFHRVPDLEERMQALYDEMAEMIEERRSDDKNIDDSAAMLKKMNVVLEKMLKKQWEAQNYKSNYYDCYSGLSAYLQEMKQMALDIDVLVFTQPEKACERTTAGFWSKTTFGIERFIASFMLDYNTAEGVGDEGAENLTLWVNWSRDQVLVLNSLINSSFTPETGINVTVRMTNASLLQGIMSGNGPDCSLSDSRTQPVNMAMRGALVDLSKYEDYEEVASWFVDGADEPYRYRDGVYGLPSTQQFYMLFYRTDIFEQYGLEVPRTWDEYLNVASILMLHNMQVGLPYAALTDIWQTNGGVASLNIFPTLLMQNGLSLYNEDKTGTSFADADTIRVFEQWTDYYTKYNLPKEYSFFNRFRIGLVPMAIQSYGQYSTLAAAAPEIKGRWEMAEIPGTPVLDENGDPVIGEDGLVVVNNKQAGYGNACMILQLAEERGKDEAAWKLLKWWMREDTQYSYALDIESILGVAGRYTSANVNATMKLDWGKEASETMLSQWNKVEEIAEIPGGYYVSRAIDQAFWNVLSMNENPKDMMKKWGEVADVEITTKIEQYKDQKIGKGDN